MLRYWLCPILPPYFNHCCGRYFAVETHQHQGGSIAADDANIYHRICSGIKRADMIPQEC